jgi:hypothetical protein
MKEMKIKVLEWYATFDELAEVVIICFNSGLSIEEYVKHLFKEEEPCQIIIRQIIDAPTVG